MKFIVLPKEDAVKFSSKKQDNRFVIISIGNVGDDEVVFEENSKLMAVLPLNFNDIDGGDGSISAEQAQSVVSFVKEWENSVGLIVIHCSAGVSRSAGVCAALMLWLHGDDSPIFDNAFYKPNMRCYRTMLNAICEGEQYEKNKPSTT